MKQNEAPLFLKNITQRRIENDVRFIFDRLRSSVDSLLSIPLQIKFPKEEDLSGAATALLRLQVNNG